LEGRYEEQEGTLQLQQECAKNQTVLDRTFGVCNRKRSFGAVALELYICWVAIKSTEHKEFSTEASEELCCAGHSRD